MSCRLYAIVMYVLHYCFELRVLKMTSKIKIMRTQFFYEWDSTNFSHTEYASLFMLRLYRLSTQNAPSIQVNVSARLWMNSFCGCVLHAATCRNMAAKFKWTAFYYNSILIIFFIWHSESKSLILLLFVLLSLCAEEINHRIVALLQWSAFTAALNSTKCISYKINNSRPYIHPTYKSG